MSKIIYTLPIAALTEGFDAYIAGNGVTRQFLADHTGFKRGDQVYWFDPNDGLTSDFAFIHDFVVNGIGEESMDVSFVLHLKGGESEELKTVTASLDDIIKIIGVISPACNWLEEEEEIDDAYTVALYAVPVGQPTIPVEGDDTVAIIPAWRIVGSDTVLLQNVIEIYNEHCFHYH